LIIIGIDPGRQTGVATVTDGKMELRTMNPFDAYAHILDLHQAWIVDKCIIEVPNTKANFHSGRSHTQSVNIGMAYGLAVNMADAIEGLLIRTIRVHPRGKVDAKAFARLTGYAGRTNQHERDAGMLAYSA